jgi:hypothetical protein
VFTRIELDRWLAAQEVAMPITDLPQASLS